MFDLFGLEKPHKITDGDEVELLTTLNDVAVVGIVRGMLDDAHIPYLVRERGSGSAMRIMTGFSLYGSDIFVPSAALEEARELIAGIEGEEVSFVDDDGNPLSSEDAAEQAADENTDGREPADDEDRD